LRSHGSRQYIADAMRRDTPEQLDLAGASALPAAAADVIAALEPLLTPERKLRIDQVIGARSRNVVAVLDGLNDPHNISAVLRSADAFGVQDVHVVARNDPFFVYSRVSQGADRWVDMVRHASPTACVSALRERGHKVYIAAMDGALRPEALAAEPKPAIVFGNEHVGVSDELRALADGSYAIPMQGFVQSLNVSVAAAITLFAAMQGRPGDLDADARHTLYARYCVLSVPRADEIIAEYQKRQSR
jgi:tRNA (guanosine-2'-O-)-methyltransferase